MPPSTTPTADRAAGIVPRGAGPARIAGRRNLLQLVQLRWLAVGGQLLTILAVHFALGIALPLGQMLTLLLALALFNLGSLLRSRIDRPVPDGELFAGLLVDVGVLAGQLYFSGGVANPFVFLFLLQVAVGAVLLERRYAFAMLVATALAFTALTQWHRDLGRPDLGQILLSTDYVGGLLICFLLNAALLVIFIERIGRNLRWRDADLAALRQRAAEEEHIVRMGLLASGAAHELGTPLATLSVILNDWSHMAPFAGDPELREEIDEMQMQLQRCKSIVARILLAAGETRAEAPVTTTLRRFLEDLVAQWRETRSGAVLHHASGDIPDLAIVSDTALAQMIDNVLDNAFEASPHTALMLRADCIDDQLVLTVRDRGPGFAPEVLERLGQPYLSTKGRAGGGLGLFLAVNVARTLGGRVAARNRDPADGGGAEVTITLPLAALAADKEDRGGR